MSRTTESPTRRKQIAAEARARRKLIADIRANRTRKPTCDCPCHTPEHAIWGIQHQGQKCPCKQARQLLS